MTLIQSPGTRSSASAARLGNEVPLAEFAECSAIPNRPAFDDDNVNSAPTYFA
jgi:hypothetical protein